MAIETISGIRRIPRADTSKYRRISLSSVDATIDMRARIRNDLKAGGNLRNNFSVTLTPTGIKVNLTI